MGAVTGLLSAAAFSGAGTCSMIRLGPDSGAGSCVRGGLGGPVACKEDRYEGRSMHMDLRGIPVTTLHGERTTFGELTEGKAALVVNVASRCGLTPQYEQLEALHEKYAPRGFTVVAFPSDQFNQEPATEEEIAEYCSVTWGVTFPMSAKVMVNGEDAHPLFQRLVTVTGENGESGDISWNFEKFVIGPGGEIARFGPRTLPDAPEVIAAIERSLPA